jgi:disulfide bond formation protein DsbB
MQYGRQLTDLNPAFGRRRYPGRSMPYETETTFFALLALALAALVAGLGLSAVFDRSGRLGLINQIRPVSLELAAAVAVVCTFGSLYLSEVVGYVPCRLCWIQRAFMYPAALVLVAALVTRRRSLALGGLGLAVFGLPVSIFHRVEEEVGSIGNVCEVANPCSYKWINHFGFVTIPTMAGIGFIGIITLASLYLTQQAGQPIEKAATDADRDFVGRNS